MGVFSSRLFLELFQVLISIVDEIQNLGRQFRPALQATYTVRRHVHKF